MLPLCYASPNQGTIIMGRARSHYYLVGVDHGVKEVVADVVQGVRRHVETDGAVEQHAPELEQGVEGQGGHVGLRPPVAALFHVLLELDPSESQGTLGYWDTWVLGHNVAYGGHLA